MSSNNEKSNSSGAKNDWRKYFSKSQGTWCWESPSRRLRLLAASRSQNAVFEAGWVILSPQKGDICSKNDLKKRLRTTQPMYWNVFTGKKVSSRSYIPEFVEPQIPQQKQQQQQALSSASTSVSPQKRSWCAMINPKKENGDEDNDQRKAAEHYNRLQRRREDRTKGSVAKMRALNNWVKAVLINLSIKNTLKSCSPSSHMGRKDTVSVLELACGKGGDFFKIQNACSSSFSGCRLDYVGIDIAQKSLEEFVQRFLDAEEKKKKKRRQYWQDMAASSSSYDSSVRLCCANLGTDTLCHTAAGTTSSNSSSSSSATAETISQLPTWNNTIQYWSLSPAFHPQDRFDLVTMQFALHYMCQSYQRLVSFFRSWSRNLNDGGYFIATTVDADVVRKHVLLHLKNNPSSYKNNSGEKHDVVIKDHLGRTSCEMSFDSKTFNKFVEKDANLDGTKDIFCWDKTLGIRYEMTLTEYNESNDEGYNFVEAPEWIVPMSTLVEVAQTYGDLHLVKDESCNFHEFYNLKKRDGECNGLLRTMKVLQNWEGEKEDEAFSRIEWDLANLYRTLVFRKGQS